MTLTEPRRAAVVYNPTKGRIDEVRRQVDAAAAAAGWGPSFWFETTVEDPGRGVTRRAVAAGTDMVIAAGGDGTVRSVAEGLRDSRVPLALLPRGTGNLLARNLGLPISSTADAIAIAFEGTTRFIDLGIATLSRTDGSLEEHGFLVMAGMGIDADIMANTNEALKKSLGWLAYVDAGLRVLPDAKPFRIRYQLENKPVHSAHVSTILFGNCGTLTAGFEMMPDAVIDDGLLDVAVLQTPTALGWIDIWRRLSFENGPLRRSSIGRRIISATSGTASTITYLRSEGITVSLEKPRAVELDGDPFGTVVGVRFTTDPGSLAVRVR
ncbi:diacylglycerol kinase family enzyme [Okibacterium sp. HSC-33S16]|uniref:diacylglycerol/lipid kinase family protein n=1 Tax=Okibacterium sp. HSC-33S16 TaxID=2910965 RepID=UPI0020A0E9E0|nr:diacylglycerol kinase family protein [Okibacterium sp. HSC-33S16]MCP2032530.1 diacylglycerol kinase family enzyme [Okibacterium sp. HSC-33S16]